MAMTTRPAQSSPRPRRASIALVLMAGLALSACGGGGNGGNGGGSTSNTLRVAVVNEVRSGPVDASVDTPSETGEITSIESCKAQVLELPIPDDDWTLMVNGQVAIDSTQMDPNLEGKNLIAEVTANDDGTVTQKSLAVGALIGAPAQAGICN